MGLIQISDDVLVNPTSVDMIELKIVNKKPVAQIHINGKVRTSNIDPKVIVRDIQKGIEDAGINKWEQFKHN